MAELAKANAANTREARLTPLAPLQFKAARARKAKHDRAHRHSGYGAAGHVGGARAARGGLAAGLALLAAAALGNAVLGTYHAGVEWKFWQGPTDCTGPIGNLGSAGDLLARLDTVKVIRCDEVQWRFLGLSLAGYNVLISLLMAAIAAWGIVMMRRERA